MATFIWTGAAKNGNWDDPLNWSLNGRRQEVFLAVAMTSIWVVGRTCLSQR
jgi:hypothetical protein